MTGNYVQHPGATRSRAEREALRGPNAPYREQERRRWQEFRALQAEERGRDEPAQAPHEHGGARGVAGYAPLEAGRAAVRLSGLPRCFWIRGLRPPHLACPMAMSSLEQPSSPKAKKMLVAQANDQVGPSKGSRATYARGSICFERPDLSAVKAERQVEVLRRTQQVLQTSAQSPRVFQSAW